MLCQVVFFFPGDTGNSTALHHGSTAFAIPVYKIVYCPGIIFLKNGYMDYILTGKNLFIDFGHLE